MESQVIGCNMYNVIIISTLSMANYEELLMSPIASQGVNNPLQNISRITAL